MCCKRRVRSFSIMIGSKNQFVLVENSSNNSLVWLPVDLILNLGRRCGLQRETVDGGTSRVWRICIRGWNPSGGGGTNSSYLWCKLKFSRQTTTRASISETSCISVLNLSLNMILKTNCFPFVVSAVWGTKLSWVWGSANLQDFFQPTLKSQVHYFHMDGALNYVFSFCRLQLEKRINFNYMPVFTRPAWLREKLATRWYNLRWALVWTYVFLVIDSHFSFRGIHQPVEL